MQIARGCLLLLGLAASVLSTPAGSDEKCKCPPPATDRPLVNGDFEGRNLNPWIVDTIPGNHYPYGIIPSRDDRNFTAGHMFYARTNHSLPGDVPQRDRFWVYLHQNMTTCPERNYTYSGNYYLPHNGVMYPMFHLYPRAQDVSALTGDTYGTNLGSWTTIGDSFIASGARVEFTAGFDSRNGGVDGDFYMDRIIVKAA